MVFLLPASPVHAGSASVSLSTESSGALTAATSGTVGSSLVITGTGFVPAGIIKVYSTVGSSIATWLTAGSCTTTNSGTGTANSLTTTSSGSTCLTASASGGFQVTATVPAMPGGAQTITVSDGTNTVNSAFTIKSKLSLTVPATNLGFPEQAIGASTFSVTGFGATEAVTVAQTAFTTASFAVTSCTTDIHGSCSFGDSLTVADQNSGSKTITATGGTSSLTATTTFTVNPWAAFYDSPGGVTAYSFLGTAPTSVLIEAHGLAAGTIAGNSITIGGVATNHAAQVVGTSGSFGGKGGQLVVAPTSQVPFGPASVVIGGVTFSFAAGNVALGSGTWGGVLISSILGTGSSTAVVTTDASSYKPGGTNTVAFFGYGFVASGAAVTIGAGGSGLGSATFHSAASCGGTCDINDAIFATASLGETPWSASGTPTTQASYAPAIAQASGPANVLGPSFTITPWDSIGGTGTVDYTTTAQTVTVHGFSASEGITVTIGGSTLTLSPACTTTTTGTATCTSGANAVPDLASGAQATVAKGSASGGTVTTPGGLGGITYAPNVSGTGALSLNSGAPGTTSILRTGATSGPHGLAANTAYNIVWNAIAGSSTVGTFTSTATGGVPIPGVQFTAPSDAAGFHTLDLQAAGNSAIYGSTIAGDTAPSVSSSLHGQYGDLVFSLTGLLSATPGVASVGVPETLSGGGLTAGTTYVVALCSPIGSCPGSISNSVPALATFVATASGAIPANTAITLADTATTTETGTVEYLSVQTAAHFGVSGSPDAYAKFVLAASGGLNMTSAPDGHGVVFTAHGLNGGSAIYNLIFNYVQSPISSTSYSGTTVGVLAPNTLGAGSLTWNVPASAAPGTYTVQLVVSTPGTGGLATGNAVLDVPMSFTVGTVASSCNTTSCMAAGTPAKTQQGAYTGISTSFTNNSNAPVTGFVYAVVHNALGQTVDISTATITAPAGGSATAFNALFGLPPGTYSVSIFVTSSAGTAISSSSTVSVTIP